MNQQDPQPSPRPGKQFERLVEAVEHLIGGAVRIEFDAHLLDRTTGTPRQFDMVLWVPSPHGELSIAIECRDKQRPVDVSEIEALYQKHHDCGVSKSIVVSRVGFSKAASRKAAFSSIDLMILRDGEEPEWPAWMEAKELNVDNLEFAVQDFSAHNSDPTPISFGQEKIPRAKLFQLAGEPPLSAEDLAEAWIRSTHLNLAVPPNGTSARIELTILLPGGASVHTSAGKQPCHHIVATIEYKQVIEKVKIRFHTFETGDGEQLVSVFASEPFLQHDGMKIVVARIIPNPDGTVQFAIVVNNAF